jgi:hypothetical protein
VQIVIIDALTEHPVSKPHRVVRCYPAEKWNIGSVIMPEPGYVIAAILLLTDDDASTFINGPRRPPSREVVVPYPEEIRQPLQRGERRWG